MILHAKNLQHLTPKPIEPLPTERRSDRLPLKFDNKSIKFLGVIFLIGQLAACSFPGVFRIDIAQGNIVTQKMIEQLEPGMTKEQVLFVMGTPVVRDTFHPNRWDYVHSFSASGTPPVVHRVTLYFEENKFVKSEGTPPPGEALF